MDNKHIFYPGTTPTRAPGEELATSLVETLSRAVGAAPRAWRAFKNNPAFVDALRKILDKNTRDEGFVGLTGWLTSKLLQPAVDEGFAAAKGFSERLIKSPTWTEWALDRVPHLGVLDSLVLGQVSRAEYVALSLGHLLKIKQRYAHLGLGTNTDIVFDGRPLTNLEVAQTWAIILNAGHLFGTFATERALMFKLYQDRRLRPIFLDAIQAQPETLRTAAEDILRKANLFRAHYALAAWRVSRLKNTATRDTMLACLGRFFERSRTTGDPIIWAFKRSRQLAYNRIHQAVGVGSLIQPGRAHDTEDMLLDVNPIAFHEHSDKENWALQLLDRADSFYQRTFFTSPAATQVVLAHIREFDVWWSCAEAAGVSLENRIAALFAHPPDWQEPSKPLLQHFVRLELPEVDDGWCKVVEDLRGDGTAWKSWKVLVTPFPAEKGFVCDVCWDGTPAPASCHALATRLGEHVVSSWHGQDSERQQGLWRSVARFGARLADEVLRPEYTLVLRPVPAHSQSIGYAILAPSRRQALGRLRTFVDRVEDEQRRRELEGVLEACEQQAQLTAGDAPFLVFLAATDIVERESGQTATEIDGLWCDLRADRVRWSFFEHKTGVQGTGLEQIRSLDSVLRAPLREITTIDLSRAQGTHGTIDWPVDLASQVG